jgi:hypothetical protein
MSTTSMGVILEGDLRADGTITLDARPPLPPGRVRVTVQGLARAAPPATRLPDPPWPDDCIPAPFDLPHFGEATPVRPRRGERRLPEPFEKLGEE